MASYHTPCCWVILALTIVLHKLIVVTQDRFTTNFFFADGAYGSITTGSYTTPVGDHANLITGNYELANGQMGNMYQGQSTAEANTRTLAIPTPWTSTGIGTAIPASIVGSYLSLTSSAPMFGMNVTPSVANATTVGASSSTGTVTGVPSQSHEAPPTTNGVSQTHSRDGNVYWAMLCLATCLYL